jgi:biopolymer transport protein ExbD
MRSARRALRELERHELANRGEPPINLVPMIDILTVLVLYLLVGTIFKQFSILQLNLPAPSTAVPTDQKPPLALTLTLRKERLEISDRNGTVRVLPNAAGAYDLATLGNVLAQVKRAEPGEDSVTLLLEPEIAYDALVSVMDAARVFPEGTEELRRGIPLFPNIAIGDAPQAGSPAPAPAAAAPAPATKP